MAKWGGGSVGGRGKRLLRLGTNSSSLASDGLETGSDVLHGYPRAASTALEEEQAGIPREIGLWGLTGGTEDVGAWVGGEKITSLALFRFHI